MINKVSVKLHVEGEIYSVGTLAQEDKVIYFKYDDSFLDTPFEISPFILPKNNKINTSPVYFFDGLYGVFADALPEGWGLLLMDKYLIKKGLSLDQVTVLDRLCLIGKQGKGALEFHPDQSVNNHFSETIKLDDLFEDIQKVVEDTPTDYILEKLYQFGGSSGGARPKVLINFDFEKNRIVDSGDFVFPSILKFPSISDFIEIPNIEYAYYLMAKEAGIEITESRLLKSEKGRYFFLTQRFDKNKFGKIHLHSAAGLLHDNFRYSNLDYGHLMDATFRLENSVKAYEKILRLAYFNLVTCNKDDHCKNFSFLMNGKAQWSFAPAYDLTYSNTAHGYHSTSFAGESKNPTVDHIKKLASIFGFNDVKHIIDQVNEAVLKWNYFADESKVGQNMTKEIKKYIENKIR